MRSASRRSCGIGEGRGLVGTTAVESWGWGCRSRGAPPTALNFESQFDPIPSPRRRGARPPFASQATEQRVVRLAAGRPARLALPGPNPANDNSAAVVGFQVCAAFFCRLAWMRTGKGTARAASLLAPAASPYLR